MPLWSRNHSIKEKIDVTRFSTPFWNRFVDVSCVEHLPHTAVLPGFPWCCHAVVPYQVLYGLDTMALPHDTVAYHTWHCPGTEHCPMALTAMAPPSWHQTLTAACSMEEANGPWRVVGPQADNFRRVWQENHSLSCSTDCSSMVAE